MDKVKHFLFSLFLLTSWLYLLNKPHQANAEKWATRDSYESSGPIKKSYPIPELNNLPLEICIRSSDFTQAETNIINAAAYTWNRSYLLYVQSRKKYFAKSELIRIINSQIEFTKIPLRLFSVLSRCINHKFPYILVIKEPLNRNPQEMRRAGTTRFIVSERNRLRYFIVKLAKDRDLKTELSSMRNTVLFMDIIIHELGHTLGIPHLEDDDLMRWDYKRCLTRSGMCHPTDKAINVFLHPYIIGFI